MAKMSTIQARIENDLKEEAEAILREMGLNTSDLMRMTFHQVVNTGGLPFQPVGMKKPSAKLLSAFAQAERGEFTTYDSVDDMVEAAKNRAQA